MIQVLNEGFGNMFPITQNEILATPHIDFGYSDALIESVVKAISKIDTLTDAYEAKGVNSGITEDEQRLYYDLKGIADGLQFGLTDYTNNLIIKSLQKKYEEVKQKEEHDCCPFCGNAVEE